MTVGINKRQIAAIALAAVALTGVSGAVTAAHAEGSGSDRPSSSSDMQKPTGERPSGGDSQQKPTGDRPTSSGKPSGSSEQGKPGLNQGNSGQQGGGIIEVFKKAGITREQADAIKKAFSSNMQQIEKKFKAEFFGAMVKKGYLTQEQADQIMADPSAMKELVKSGAISEENAKAIWAARKAAPKPAVIAMKAALTSLVADGTITQEQGDAVLEYFAKMVNSGEQGGQKPTGDRPTGQKPSGDSGTSDRPSSSGKPSGEKPSGTQNPFESTGLTQAQLETVKKTFAANMQAAGDSKNAQVAMKSALETCVENGTITQDQADAIMEYFSKSAGRR